MKKDAIVFFEDYEKISDVLMWFNRDVTLKFVITLASKDKDNNRQHFHKEYKTPATKYNNVDKTLSIARNFKYYLTLSINRDLDNSIMIRQSDMVMLKLKLKKIIKWFGELYKDDNGKIVISGDYEPITMYIGEFSTIQFDPIVIQLEDRGEFKEGIRVTLNNSYYFDMSIDTFFEFYYIIDSFNMYQAAITLLNYLPAEFGKTIKDTSEFGSYNNTPYKRPVAKKNFFTDKK